MASSGRRVLGQGRVLGTPKAPASPSPIPEHLRPNGALSPSASTTSLHSQQSSSKSSVDENDIRAAVAATTYTTQAQQSGAIAAIASNQLVCPICNDQMVTLLQLNRHLDDDHKDIEETEQDEVKTWFKTQMVKAKRFQPLAVLNQKLKGLDVFEPNDEVVRARSASPAAQVGRQVSQPGRPVIPQPPAEVIVQDPDELVTKDHWQRYTRDGTCSDPLCGRRLGGTNGNINCRRCGKLFCEEHTMYQMKLSRSANWEPVRGYWFRVCETCYKSREGYIDHSGAERDHLTDFKKVRRKAVDKNYLEVSRLEKRLTKLTQLLADPTLHQETSVVAYLWSFSGQPDQKRLAEQTIVDWEEDTKVTKCPFCQQEFSNYTFRRHHCRLCGRVVCADPLTKCSFEIGLNVAAKPDPSSEKTTPDQIPIDVRMCEDCKRTVFSKSDFAAEAAVDTADQRAFNNLKQFEHGIRVMLPRFQKLLATLQNPDVPPTPQQLADATRARKRLTDAFTQYNVAARRIHDLPTTSPSQQRLQQQVFAQASTFLHLHMLPLKHLPKVLKHAHPPTANGHLSPSPANRHGLSLPSRPGALHSPSPSYDSANADIRSQSSALSELEFEEKELRERLIVLEEQKFLVEEMVRDAQRRRRLEEVESLGRNLEEISKEVDAVRGQLEQVSRGFGEVYAGSVQDTGIAGTANGAITAKSKGKSREGLG